MSLSVCSASSFVLVNQVEITHQSPFHYQQHLGLNTGMLGLALWGIAIGALLSQSLAGWLVTRLSSRMVMRVASLLYCMALPLPALAMDLPRLMLALFAPGLTNGLLDVAMTVQ